MTSVCVPNTSGWHSVLLLLLSNIMSGIRWYKKCSLEQGQRDRATQALQRKALVSRSLTSSHSDLPGLSPA
jgi:hypothetical protein